VRPEQLPIRIRDGQVAPSFLTEIDLPWLTALLELVKAHVGARWRDLDARLRNPVLDHVPRRRHTLAVTVLRRLLRGRVQAPVPPRKLRGIVFRLAASGLARDEVFTAAAEQLGIDPSDVEAALFSDLPGERLVTLATSLPSPSELRLQSNLQLARALLSRAIAVEIRLRGNARAVLRVARLRGLLCTVTRDDPSLPEVTLSLSGPLSLFRRTTIYGRALGSLLPTLAWAESFNLLATCWLGGDETCLRLQSGDPIMPADEPKRYDSLVEERLARQLGRRAPDWIIVREPEPIPVGRTFIFPDFALIHRYDATRRWLLEIVGFWTPDYLEAKLRTYRQARLDRLILCIDDRRACARDDLPSGAHIVRYHTRVDVNQVLSVLATDPVAQGADSNLREVRT
jgi:hypothetical protein